MFLLFMYTLLYTYIYIELKALFGWTSIIPPTIIATQLIELSRRYRQFVSNHHRAITNSTTTTSTTTFIDSNDRENSSTSYSNNFIVEASSSIYKQYNEDIDTTTNTRQEFREKLTELVPQIYHRLNSFASIKQNNIQIQQQQQQQQQVLKILEYSSWIWVGDSFVSVDQVALSSGLNIPPYLYQLSPDLKVLEEVLVEVITTYHDHDYVLLH